MRQKQSYQRVRYWSGRRTLRLVTLDHTDLDLLRKTHMLLEERASEISGVSAGLRTSKGREYFGLCIDLKTATVGMCAEYSAVGAMVTAGGRDIMTIVAVTDKGRGRYAVLPPCGKCRDLIRGFGDPYVIVQTGRQITNSKKARVSEFVPRPWNEIQSI